MFWDSDFNGDISGWNVGGITFFTSMFNENDNFNGDISKWNGGDATHVNYMFFDSGFNRNIANWDLSSAIYFEDMLKGAAGYTTATWLSTWCPAGPSLRPTSGK